MISSSLARGEDKWSLHLEAVAHWHSLCLSLSTHQASLFLSSSLPFLILRSSSSASLLRLSIHRLITHTLSSFHYPPGELLLLSDQPWLLVFTPTLLGFSSPIRTWQPPSILALIQWPSQDSSLNQLLLNPLSKRNNTYPPFSAVRCTTTRQTTPLRFPSTRAISSRFSQD